MRQIVLKFGLASGFLISAVTAIMLPLCMRGVIDFSASEVVGYTTMVLAFLMVFFGIRSYREEVAGGTIGFGKAFGVGLLITLVACAVYVVAWEIVYWFFIPDFLDHYTAYLIEKLRSDGASQAAIATKQQEMAAFAELYANPLINSLITFLEVFPVGLLVTLVSAGILRRAPKGGQPATEVGEQPGSAGPSTRDTAKDSPVVRISRGDGPSAAVAAGPRSPTAAEDESP